MTRALPLVLPILAAMAGGCRSQSPIVLQAERAELHDLTVATTRPSFEGEGYVNGFKNETGELVFHVDAPSSAVYDVTLRYTAPPGGKGYAMSVNGVGNDGFLPPSPEAFAAFEAGKIELAKGKNEIRLGKGWGYYEIDALTLRPSKPYPKPKPVRPALANANASPEARQLMRRLTDHYGKTTFSGVINARDRDYVRSVAGVTPAIMAGDLIEYTPSRRERGSDPKNETERLIGAARAGHIVSLCWHWNAPKDLIDKREHVDANGNTIDASWYRGFYTNSTTFDFTPGLESGTEDHALLLRDIDTIALELRKLADAKVPVLWRPLHESDGKWFWWGTRGPENFKRLWRLVYDRLTVHHKLDNLIWVYTWSDHGWYPGDDVVDLVGIDAYPSKVNDTLAGKWGEALSHFDGKKLIALSEYGGVPDVDRAGRLGITWSYFASWTGNNGPQRNPKDELARIYRSPRTTNLAPTPTTRPTQK